MRDACFEATPRPDLRGEALGLGFWRYRRSGERLNGIVCSDCHAAKWFRRFGFHRGGMEGWGIGAGDKEHHFCRFDEQQHHRRGREKALHEFLYAVIFEAAIQD